MNRGIGIDLGGTQIKGALFDLGAGKILEKTIVETNDGDFDGAEPRFVGKIRQLAKELGKDGVDCVGISAPGMTNREGTCIKFLPGRLNGIEGLDWTEVIGRPTRVVNDAHAALLGEIWKGSAESYRDVFMLTLGTGVGGAVVADGKLLRGAIGRAGHLGHVPIDFRGDGDICGTPGSLEDFVGNHNVAKRSNGRYSSTRDLIDAVKGDDPEAIAVWDESMRALAAGVAGLVNVLDPEAVIIGGGICAAWDEIEPRLSRNLDEFEWRPGGHVVKVIRAGLGEWAGVYGAMSFATDSDRVKNV